MTARRRAHAGGRWCWRERRRKPLLFMEDPIVAEIQEQRHERRGEDDAVVQAEHVEQTVAHTRARTVWELVDAVADRDASKALARAHALLDQGERALGLLNLVVRQFRQLLLGRSALLNGASPDQAAAAAGVPSFRVRAFVRQVERYQGRELLDALDRLAAADRALKGSKVPDALVFEGLVLDLCAPR